MLEIIAQYREIILLSSIPIISGIIGWSTNYIAVKMIFRPRKPFQFFFLTIQGLVPKRQKELAEKVGETVEKELISHQDIREALNKPSVHNKMNTLISEQIDLFVTSKLSANPLIAMFLQGDFLDQIKSMLVAQLEASMPDLLDSLMTSIEDEVNFRDIVKEKIENFDLSKLEAIIQNIASKELKLIEILGGALGFLIGIGQVAIISLW